MNAVYGMYKILPMTLHFLFFVLFSSLNLVKLKEKDFRVSDGFDVVDVSTDYYCSSFTGLKKTSRTCWGIGRTGTGR